MIIADDLSSLAAIHFMVHFSSSDSEIWCFFKKLFCKFVFRQTKAIKSFVSFLIFHFLPRLSVLFLLSYIIDNIQSRWLLDIHCYIFLPFHNMLRISKWLKYKFIRNLIRFGIKIPRWPRKIEPPHTTWLYAQSRFFANHKVPYSQRFLSKNAYLDASVRIVNRQSNSLTNCRCVAQIQSLAQVLQNMEGEKC